jgi:hypothetical protein
MAESATQNPEPVHPRNKRVRPVGCIVIIFLLIAVPIFLAWLYLGVIQPWFQSGGFSRVSEKLAPSEKQPSAGETPGANAPETQRTGIDTYIEGMAASMPASRGAQFPSVCQQYLALYPDINQDQQLLLVCLIYQCYSADGKIDKKDDRYIQQTMQIFLQIDNQPPATASSQQTPSAK